MVEYVTQVRLVLSPEKASFEMCYKITYSSEIWVQFEYASPTHLSNLSLTRLKRLF